MKKHHLAIAAVIVSVIHMYMRSYVSAGTISYEFFELSGAFAGSSGATLVVNSPPATETGAQWSASTNDVVSLTIIDPALALPGVYTISDVYTLTGVNDIIESAEVQTWMPSSIPNEVYVLILGITISSVYPQGYLYELTDFDEYSTNAVVGGLWVDPPSMTSVPEPSTGLLAGVACVIGLSINIGRKRHHQVDSRTVETRPQQPG